MLLRVAHYLAMRRHVAGEAPREACGLVAGRGGVSTEVFPITNVLHSSVRYRMAPEEQLRAFRRIEAAGDTLLAIYHSHPAGPPTLSSTDLREAAYLSAVYLVWAPVGTTWLVRGFLLDGRGVREILVRLAGSNAWG